MDQFDVVVIGAGFSGLTAARELSHDGRRVLVLEARDRIGGTSWYQEDALDGIDLEMGGTWIVPQQRHVFAEVKRYDIPVQDSELPERMTWSAGGKVLDSLLPCSPAEYADLETALRTLLVDGASLDPDRPLSEQGLEDLDVPIRQWADQAGLRGNARELLISWFCGCANANEDTGSALDILCRLAAMDNSLWGMVQASVLGYSFTEGARPLARAIAGDGEAEIRLATPVRAVESTVDGVTVRFDGGEVAASRVLMTVPIWVWPDIDFTPALPADKLAAATENHAGQGQKVWALARDVPEDLSGFGWHTKFDYVGAMYTTERGVVLVCFAPEHNRVDPDDLADVQRAVREFAPQPEVLDATAHDWVHDEFSKGTWATFRPRQYTRYEKVLGRPEGRVHFSGSHTATRWRTFIDGGIESGLRGAAEILAEDKK